MNATANKTEALMPNGVPVSFHEKLERESAKAKVWAVKEGYALKGLKVFEAGSEETTCFVADITKNRKVVGHAKNDGYGGSTFVELRGLALTYEESGMIETWVDDEVQTQADQKWVDRNTKSMAKSGVDFVLIFKVGGMKQIVGDYGVKAEVVAKATKKMGVAPITVIDLTATSAQVRKVADDLRTAKWEAKTKVQLAGQGAKAVVFYKGPKGGLCRGFVTVDKANDFAKTAENAKVVTL